MLRSDQMSMVKHGLINVSLRGHSSHKMNAHGVEFNCDWLRLQGGVGLLPFGEFALDSRSVAFPSQKALSCIGSPLLLSACYRGAFDYKKARKRTF